METAEGPGQQVPANNSYSTGNTMSTIERFICRELLQRGDLTLDEGTPLIENGYLTSLQTVELVVFLEQEFQIEIPPEEVNEEQFNTLGALTALVERKASEPA